MASEMKMEITATETIKPSSPTPQHLRSYKLSLLDQFALPFYVPLLLFYTKNHVPNQQRLHKLKNSLPQALARFYPLAGRMNNDKSSINCEDDGVLHFEARFHGFLSSFLQNPDANLLERLLPPKAELFKPSAPLLFVQSSFFDCGGVAIGLQIHHKVADAATLIRFIHDWSLIAIGHDQTQLPVLDFDSASYFPPSDFAAKLPSIDYRKYVQKRVTKRFVLDASKMAALKAKAASLSVEKPSRVEAVVALLWKCAMNAYRLNTGEVSVKSAMHIMVNIRKRVEPPLPETTIGNHVLYFATEMEEESEKELQDLVADLRKRIKEFGQVLVEGDKKSKSEVMCEYMKGRVESLNRDDMIVFSCTSWCNFGIYETDFGWGKPIWMCLPGDSLKNFITLLDNKQSDGVEVWITLNEEEMALFERDDDILNFALSNPSALESSP